MTFVTDKESLYWSLKGIVQVTMDDFNHVAMVGQIRRVSE